MKPFAWSSGLVFRSHTLSLGWKKLPCWKENPINGNTYTNPSSLRSLALLRSTTAYFAFPSCHILQGKKKVIKADYRRQFKVTQQMKCILDGQGKGMYWKFWFSLHVYCTHTTPSIPHTLFIVYASRRVVVCLLLNFSSHTPFKMWLSRNVSSTTYSSTIVCYTVCLLTLWLSFAFYHHSSMLNIEHVYIQIWIHKYISWLSISKPHFHVLENIFLIPDASKHILHTTFEWFFCSF